jgi:deoxyxylulose-5-phosphate synthase
MDLTNEVLLWWWAIGLRYARPLEGHDLQRAVRVLQHALHRDTPPLAVSSQLAARSSQLAALSLLG